MDPYSCNFTVGLPIPLKLLLCKTRRPAEYYVWDNITSPMLYQELYEKYCNLALGFVINRHTKNIFEQVINTFKPLDCVERAIITVYNNSSEYCIQQNQINNDTNNFSATVCQFARSSRTTTLTQNNHWSYMFASLRTALSKYHLQYMAQYFESNFAVIKDQHITYYENTLASTGRLMVFTFHTIQNDNINIGSESIILLVFCGYLSIESYIHKITKDG